MISEVLKAYARVPKVIAVAPLMFLLPFLAEGLQHILEFDAGLFSSGGEQAKPDFSAGLLASGALKELVLLYVMFWVPRFFFRDGGSNSLKFNGREILSIVIALIATGLLIAAIMLILPASIILVEMLSLPLSKEATVLVALSVVAILLLPTQLIFLHLIGRFLGDERIPRWNFIATLGTAWKSIVPVMVILIVPGLPLLGLHYVFHFMAMGAPATTQYIIMATDSALVGVLAILFGTSLYGGYTRAFPPTNAA